MYYRFRQVLDLDVFPTAQITGYWINVLNTEDTVASRKRLPLNLVEGGIRAQYPAAAGLVQTPS